MAEEIPQLVISTSDRIMSRGLGEEGTPTSDRWELSSPIPGMRIINTWQVYNKIWLVLALTEDGHYHIFRSINLQRYSLVHVHECRIFGLYFVDDGHAIFCAEDGWWATRDTGITWEELALGDWGAIPDLDEVVPEFNDDVPELNDDVPEFELWRDVPHRAPFAKSASIIALRENVWAIVAYGDDHKIYYAEYPEGDFLEVYDTTEIWADKWYPAIAGCPVGILAGAGNQLLRSVDVGAEGSWQAIQEVAGIIKGIAISNQSDVPVFLITVEREGGDVDTLYMTYDLGDSLIPNANRMGSVASVQSVTPTGTNELQTTFAVLGQRVQDGPATYRLIQEGG